MQDTRSLSDVVTDALASVSQRYNAFIRDCANDVREEHIHDNNGLRAHECPDCEESIEACGDSEWAIYTRNAYLVALISENRDAWRELSDDIDSFGEDYDSCMPAIAALAIVADVRAELERD